MIVPGGRALITTWIPEGGLDAVAGIATRAVFAALGQAPPPRFPWADRAAVAEIVGQAGGRARSPRAGSSVPAHRRRRTSTRCSPFIR